MSTPELVASVSELPNAAVDATTDDAFWPAPRPGQVRVLLLGTYHMDNPGLDEVNVDSDDVLADDRQAELRDLANRLERWQPDKVAVERPYDRVDDVNAVYEQYRSGEYEYDTEVEIEPPQPYRDDPATECRSEVVQVGFRLADRLDRDAVHAIDCPASMHNEDAEELEERGFEPGQKVDVPRLDMETMAEELDERLTKSTIPAYHRWLNQESTLRNNHYGMFGQYVRYGEGDNFAGPEELGSWYERNLKMVHNVWRLLDDEQGENPERVLLVVGSGHVRILRHLFDEAPMFCPVNPLPYLS